MEILSNRLSIGYNRKITISDISYEHLQLQHVESIYSYIEIWIYNAKQNDTNI